MRILLMYGSVPAISSTGTAARNNVVGARRIPRDEIADVDLGFKTLTRIGCSNRGT